MRALMMSVVAVPLWACHVVPNLPPPECGEVLCSEDQGEGVTWTHVDATADEDWVWWSLADQEFGLVSELPQDESWDVAFQRYKIFSNSGVTGIGPVEVSWWDDVPFSDVVDVPDFGWITDAEGTVGRNDPATAFLVEGGWYEYLFDTHQLAPRNRVYVVHGSADDYMAIRFAGYYDGDGEAGHPHMRWKWLE